MSRKEVVGEQGLVVGRGRERLAVRAVQQRQMGVGGRFAAERLEHQQLARRVERAAVPERPHIGRGPRYLVQPSISTACAPSLRAIAEAAGPDCLIVDPWNALGTSQVFAYVAEVAALQL